MQSMAPFVPFRDRGAAAHSAEQVGLMVPRRRFGDFVAVDKVTAVRVGRT